MARERSAPERAGRIARNRSNPDKPTETKNVGHPRYVEREDFDRLQGERKGRDRAVGSNRRAKGRPNANHLLAKLAVCGRCGQPMFCRTSSYRRKLDGGRARSYICREVAEGTGRCGALVVDAEMIEPKIVAHLERYLIDFDAWLHGMTSQSQGDYDRLEAMVSDEQSTHGRHAATVTMMSERYAAHVLIGDDVLAAADAEAMHQAAIKRDQSAHRLSELRGALAAAHVVRHPTDAVLDLYNDLSSEIAGVLQRGKLQEVNAGLRARFDRFLLERSEECVTVMPILHGVRTLGDMAARGSEVSGTGLVLFEDHGDPFAPTPPFVFPASGPEENAAMPG